MDDQQGRRQATPHAQNVNEHIARLNDLFRRDAGRGVLLVTAGIIALGDGAVADILDEVRLFERFSRDNDPYGEHDFGAFYYRGQRLFWKIDYYDQSMRGASPDPGDPSVTTRTLTVMLGSEY